jgi:hypothetical protein
LEFVEAEDDEPKEGVALAALLALVGLLACKGLDQAFIGAAGEGDDEAPFMAERGLLSAV